MEELNLLIPGTCVSLRNFSGFKKSLKISKGQSNTVYRRRTDNTMAIRTSTKDKQRSTKHTNKTKDRVTRTTLKTAGELYRTAYFSRKNTSLTLIDFLCIYFYSLFIIIKCIIKVFFIFVNGQ